MSTAGHFVSCVCTRTQQLVYNFHPKSTQSQQDLQLTEVNKFTCMLHWRCELTSYPAILVFCWVLSFFGAQMAAMYCMSIHYPFLSIYGFTYRDCMSLKQLLEICMLLLTYICMVTAPDPNRTLTHMDVNILLLMETAILEISFWNLAVVQVVLPLQASSQINASLDVMLSCSLFRICFVEYQTSSVVLGWPGDWD